MTSHSFFDTLSGEAEFRFAFVCIKEFERMIYDPIRMSAQKSDSRRVDWTAFAALAVLCILSVKLKKPALIAIFALSFVCSLGMGYLSSQDFAEASMNWIAEGVNVAGQGSLLIGVLLLHKKGLAQLKLRGGETA